MPEFWIKIHDGFPEHPETVGLSDKAFRAIVELWCYCHRAGTDGKVPEAIFNRYPSKCKTELLAHYVEDREDHYYMHGYAEWQQTNVDLEAKRRAGSLGGKARARNMALAKEVLQAEPSTLLENANSETLLDIDIDNRQRLKSSRAGKPARTHQLPPDFEVTEAMKSWARANCPNLDVTRETERFKDWHTAKGSLMKDWPAAWRTWMHKAVDYAPAKPASPQKAAWF